MSDSPTSPQPIKDSATSLAVPPDTLAADSTPASPRRRRWLSWLVQGLLFAALYFGVSAYNEQDLLSGNAPGFLLRDLQGKNVSLESFRGKRVLLHFWATWCGVCHREFGALNDVAAHVGQDAVLLSVVSDGDDIDRIRQYAKENNIQYPVLLASERVVEAYRIRAFPTNYFINKNGTITSKTVGMSTRWGLRARLALAR